jgi:hypothetical protein
MDIENRRLGEVLEGLLALGGQRTGLSSKLEPVVLGPLYFFKPATLHRLAVNIRRVRAACEELEDAKTALVKQEAVPVTPDGKVELAKLPPDKADAFNAKFRELMRVAVDCRARDIVLMDLDLAHNQIPPQVLAQIAPLVPDLRDEGETPSPPFDSDSPAKEQP